MNAEERVAAARRQLMEAEASMLQALAAARSSLSAVEEENRELRRQAARSEIEVFTEEQFAKRCQVSAQTIARLRKEGKIDPLMIGGVLVRYSSRHLEDIHEIFGVRAKRKLLREAG